MFLPQMSPMWWTMLMMMFIFMIMITINMMYFNYSKMMTKKTEMIKKNKNWMW